MRKRNVPHLRTFYRVVSNTLVIDLGSPKRVLSSAPQGGGLRSTRYILNHQVDAHPVAPGLTTSVGKKRNPTGGDPVRYLGRLASTLGAEDKSVGLMTAVPMKQLVMSREESGGVWVECFATVGVTNAVRAGEWPNAGSDRKRRTQVGTINLILITNAALSSSAMVGVVQVATESKTGILRDYAVPSWTGVPGATGTGTDAVVIACGLREQGVRLSYSGTHTVIGAMVGRVVAECVTEGLARAKRWTARATHRSRPV